MNEQVRNKEITDEEIVARTKAALDSKTGSLDAATRSKLNQARQRALAELDKSRSAGRYWLPAAGATACAVLAVALLVNKPATDIADQPTLATTVAFDDFDILMAEESIDMLQDLEFFELMELLDETASEAETIG